jgi:CRISPR-associated protein Cas1
MTDRFLDLSDNPAHLNTRGALLVVRGGSDGRQETTVPLAEISAVVASHPAVTLTLASLARLAEAGVPLVVCDDHRMPTAMMLPLEGHFTQAERFERQIAASLPMRKRLWRDIVRAKVRAQGRLLARVRGDDGGLERLAEKVLSGDTGNIEARAARLYWPLLFGPDFARRRDAEDQNRLLNYGYAVLRAAVSRAICASGLHPSLGLQHHNRYDAFRLADDLMEPLRPLVDEAVVGVVEKAGPGAPLDAETKSALLAILTSRVKTGRERRVLPDALGHYAASLADVFGGVRRALVIPEA